MAIDYKNLKIGDTFWECGYRTNVEYTVTDPPKVDTVYFEDREVNQWAWKAISTDGNEIDFLITEGFEHYGPKLYYYQAYMKGLKNE